MGTLQAAFLCFILLRTWVFAADYEVWKTASATYTKEKDGSIITGMPLALTCGACYELRCVDHILWCLQGSPSIILTATDFCPPNYGLSSEYGGWCNFPKQHFEMSEAAFGEIA